MKTKIQLRKKFLSLRKKKYFELSKVKFTKLSEYLKRKTKTIKKPIIALYYPSNYEINILKILESFKTCNVKFLLPKIQNNNLLSFVEWKERDVLLVNKFGIPEPLKKQKKIYLPDIVLVPLLAFDNNRNRLEAIGVAFSFQKFKKIPSSSFDFQLNNIFTEKGFIE